jgi:hypothetical protein
MSNFNIKKFLIENKLTRYSNLSEESFNDSEVVRGAEEEFEYNGDIIMWTGDYEKTTSGTSSDYDYPGDSETEIEIINTNDLKRYIESENDWESIEDTPEILDIVIDRLKNR